MFEQELSSTELERSKTKMTSASSSLQSAVVAVDVAVVVAVVVGVDESVVVWVEPQIKTSLLLSIQ